MGMRYYVSSADGIGGRLKGEPADFRVIERPGLDCRPVDADTGDYPYLVVEATATERDTNGVIEAIARAMDVPPQAVGVAGTKDANAVTTQWVSIRTNRCDPPASLDGIELEAVGRLGRQLEFGDHAGNRFEVVVREATDGGRIEAVADALTGEDGRTTVPNFFGHQRFGARRAITHVVGNQLLSGEYRQAVETYLTASSPHEPERTRRARQAVADALASDDLEGAAAALPGYLTYEQRLVDAMADADGDPHRAAIEALPWSLVRMFVHAVQSHVFNELVSERLRRGISLVEPQVGDTVCFVDDAGRVDTERAQPVTARRLDTARRHCDRGRAVVVGPLVGPETPAFEGPVGRCYEAVLGGLGLSRETFADVAVTDVETVWRPLALSTELSIGTWPPTFAFALPPGSYATVVLREFLKVDPVRMA